MLIRTLNDHFLEEDDMEGDICNDNHNVNFSIGGYLRTVTSFFVTAEIDQRMAKFLCKKLTNDPERLTHAFLEEFELLMSIIC